MSGKGLQPVVLGIKPFILIEFSLDQDEAITVDIKSGGGVSPEDVPAMLHDLGHEFLSQRGETDGA